MSGDGDGDPFVVRLATEPEHAWATLHLRACVWPTWLELEERVRMLFSRPSAYYAAASRAASRVIRRHDALVFVASARDCGQDTGVLAGFSVLSAACVWYVYVRREARGCGLARRLTHPGAEHAS